MNERMAVLALALLALQRRRNGGSLRVGLGAVAEVGSAPDRRWERAGGLSDRAGAGRHHLLARSRRCRRSPHLRFFRARRMSRAPRSIFPRPSASPNPTAARPSATSGGVVFPIRVRGRRSLETGDARARRELCGLRKNLPAGAGGARIETAPTDVATPFAAEIDAARSAGTQARGRRRARSSS